MVGRNVTRTILNATETTSKTKNVTGDSLSFPFTTSDYLYIGYVKPFTTRHFNMAVANTAPSNMIVEFWRHDETWQPVEDLLDGTEGFTKSGFVTWQIEEDWDYQELAPVGDRELYWVRISVDADLDAGTEIQSIINLFCDDVLLEAYYPELITDTRYLPSGRSDYMLQYQAAKNELVLRLKQKKVIDEEADIIDINDVAIAACHAAAKIILSPIASDDATKDVLARAKKDFEKYVSDGFTTIDLNNDGTVQDEEKGFPRKIRLHR